MDIGMVEISRWHQEAGFPKSVSGLYCGYHYVVRRSGVIEVARPESEVGAHTKGHNTVSIGIVWVGRDQTKKEQWESLVKITATVVTKYGLEPKNIFGHTELNPGKTCPNISSLDFFRDCVELEINKREVK
jgi:N-acetylmuramoyl-L-alanine amidase